MMKNTEALVDRLIQAQPLQMQQRIQRAVHHAVQYGENYAALEHHLADIDEVTAKYDPAKLRDGYNTMPDGEEIFYISNPALGLWAFKDRFKY